MGLSRTQAVVVLVAVALAVVLAGVGLYANGQVAEPVKVRDQVVGERQPGDPGYRAPHAMCATPRPASGTAAEWWQFYCGDNFNLVYAPVYDDAPLPVLRSGAAPWWWFGAAAVLVLGLASIPLARRRPEPPA